MQNIDCLETDGSTEGGHVGCEGDWRGSYSTTGNQPLACPLFTDPIALAFGLAVRDE